MAREIGNLYYTLGIKGASDFTKTLEDARRAVSSLPQTYNHPVLGKIYDPDDLRKFGTHLDRIFSSSADVFEQKFSKKVASQISKMQDMLSAMSPGDKGFSGISKMLDTLKAGGGRVSAEQIRAMQEGRTTFEENLRRATNQRSATERTLRASQDTGVISKGSAYSNYLEAGLASQIMEESTSNKIAMQSMKTNAEIAKAVEAYDASGHSAAGLLELQKQVNLALHEESRVRNSILATQERQRAAALNDKYAFVESRGKKYSRESVMLGNAAFSDASNDRKLRMRAAATADIDQEIARKRAILEEDPAYKDQTSKIAMDLKLEIDGLVRVREELAMLADEMDDFIEKQGLAPRALPSSVGFAIDQEKAKENLLNTGADLSGTSVNEQVSAFNKAKKQREIDAIVSNTKTGRYTGFQSQSADEIKKAQDLLNKDAAGTISLTRDQEVALKNHVVQWQKLAQLSRNVLDVLGKISDEEEAMSKAMASGDSSAVEKHRKNLMGLNRDLNMSVRAVNNFNNETHAASMASGRWNYQMQEIGYGIQDFLQVLSGGGGLGPALRSASNNFSQFFAAAGGPTAAIASTAVALGVLGISVAMDHLGKSTEDATGKIDDLIERLRIAGELNAEYAKSQGTVFGAMTGEKVSNYSEATALRVSIQSQQRIMTEELRKSLYSKGYGGIYGQSGVPLPGLSSESGMSFWETVSADINKFRPFENTAYGTQSNELTGSYAAQGIFDRILKQRFVEGRMASQVELPKHMTEALNQRERELSKQIMSAKDLDEAINMIAEAGGSVSDELKKLANQVFLTKERMAEMEKVQKDAVSAYAARRSSMASDEQRMSLFSGEVGKRQRASYADVFIESAKEYQQSQSGAMKSTAQAKSSEAFTGFRTNTAGGKYEGPAADISNFMSGAFSDEIGRIASLRAIIDSPESSNQIKASAAAMAATLNKEMAPQAVVGMRSVISGYSPSQRVGESPDAYISRVKSEVTDMATAMTEFGNAIGVPQQQMQELAKAIEVVGDKAVAAAEKSKRAVNLETSNAAMAGKFSRRSDEDVARRANEIASAEKEAITAAIDDYLNSNRSQADVDLMNARVNEAKVKSERDFQEVDRTYQKEMFASKSMLGGDIAKLIGGREGQKYQAELNHIERLRRIEEDKNLTDPEKKAAADIEGRIFGAEMEQIDRKNVSFTDVGSQWKTIQQSLQGDYTKKLSKEFHDYMTLAQGEGVKVRLAIGN